MIGRNKQAPLMTPQLNKRHQQLQQQSNCSSKQGAKKQKLTEKETCTSESRSWAHMDHDILISIMKLLDWQGWASCVCYVCKSWQSARLDSMFPPGYKLDLSPFNSIPKDKRFYRRRYHVYVKLVLACRLPTEHTCVHFPRTPLRVEAYKYIAQSSASVTV